jgi:glycerol-3-phosphate dehydrogenase (NAD(P)+)
MTLSRRIEHQRIGVVGGGAWGTALAMTARRAGREVLLWARETEVVEAIRTTHRNPVFLPGIDLAAGAGPAIAATGSLADLAWADAVLMVVPAQHLRAVSTALAGQLRAATPIVLCAKGIETGTGAMMTEIAASALPGHPVAVLSGPTFAAEVAAGLPTAITLAATDQELGRQLIGALGTRVFRPYLSDDPIGCEIGGAVKNVLAIACGIVLGRAMGDNARAALITRGLAEMTRLALARGGRAETLMGLSGLGDLTLTCTGLQSRNMSLGRELGAGRRLADILAERRSIAEGVDTAAAVAALARNLGVEMPIVAAVDAILHHGADVTQTVIALLDRPFRTEGLAAPTAI